MARKKLSVTIRASLGETMAEAVERAKRILDGKLKKIIIDFNGEKVIVEKHEQL